MTLLTQNFPECFWLCATLDLTGPLRARWAYGEYPRAQRAEVTCRVTWPAGPQLAPLAAPMQAFHSLHIPAVAEASVSIHCTVSSLGGGGAGPALLLALGGRHGPGDWHLGLHSWDWYSCFWEDVLFNKVAHLKMKPFPLRSPFRLHVTGTGWSFI